MNRLRTFVVGLALGLVLLMTGAGASKCGAPGDLPSPPPGAVIVGDECDHPGDFKREDQHAWSCELDDPRKPSGGAHWVTRGDG